MISEETKIKDLIPEGWELDWYSDLDFDLGDKAEISIHFKKKVVKDWNWYIENYLISGLDSNLPLKIINKGLVTAYIATYRRCIDEGKFTEIPFEIKIGLLKFICDDHNLSWRFIINNYPDSDSFDGELEKIKSICPTEFLNSIFEV